MSPGRVGGGGLVGKGVEERVKLQTWDEPVPAHIPQFAILVIVL